jgi:hypothetical protein
VRRSGECLPGDTFYLLTDALACWFLTAVESDREPWRELDEVGAGACPFDGWVAHLRRSGNLRNDDVTAVRVSLD